MLVFPVKVLMPLRMRFPLPDLINPPVLVESMTPARVTFWLFVSIVIALVLPLKRVDQSCAALLPVYCSAPPVKVILPPLPNALG